MIVGSGKFRYRVNADWAKLPDGWSFKEVGGGGVDSNDNKFSGMVDAQRCATSNASRHHGQTYMLLSGPMFRVRFSHR